MPLFPHRPAILLLILVIICLPEEGKERRPRTRRRGRRVELNGSPPIGDDLERRGGHRCGRRDGRFQRIYRKGWRRQMERLGGWHVVVMGVVMGAHTSFVRLLGIEARRRDGHCRVWSARPCSFECLLVLGSVLLGTNWPDGPACLAAAAAAAASASAEYIGAVCPLRDLRDLDAGRAAQCVQLRRELRENERLLCQRLAQPCGDLDGDPLDEMILFAQGPMRRVGLA